MSSRITSGFDIKLCIIGLSSICLIISGFDITCCCICDWISAKLELPKPNAPKLFSRLEPPAPPRPPPNGKLNRLFACCGCPALVWFVPGCGADALAEEAAVVPLLADAFVVGSFGLFIFITRWTVTPSLMPCCKRVSWSFRIFPENIKQSCSFVFENFLPTSSFN